MFSDNSYYSALVSLFVIVFRKLIDFVLYSNLLIAIGAASLVYQTELITGSFSLANHYAHFVFFATIFIYSSHRIIGFSKLHRITNNRRINIILQFHRHIILYATVGVVGLAFSAFYLSKASIIWLLLPSAMATFYILPIFGRKRRFRDLPFIKVFAIGVVWAWVCVFIPLLDFQKTLGTNELLFLLEKFFFIIGITLPFDIRDIKVDRMHNIRTIPIYLGEKKSRQLSLVIVLMAWIFTTANFSLDYLSLAQWLALTTSYLITGATIRSIGEKSNDYLFTGVLDGTIFLQFILLWLVN